jgi:hypothetical protein
MKSRWLGFWIGLAAVGLPSCDRVYNLDYTRAQLVGNYYLTTNYEGYSFLHYGSPWFHKPQPLLGSVDSTGIASHYLVVCEVELGDFYLLPLTAENEQQAIAGKIGPFSQTAYRRQLYQLTGNSSPHLFPTPR